MISGKKSRKFLKKMLSFTLTVSQYRKIHQLNRKDYGQSCKDETLFNICSTGASTLGRRF